MVIEMTKYSFILLEEETEGFLERLQQLGVVDMTRSLKPVDEESSAMLEKATEEKKAISILKKAVWDDDPDKDAITAAASKTEMPQHCIHAAIKASSDIASLQEKMTALHRTAKARLPWGDFSMSAVKDLEKRGLKMRFYMVSRKAFQESWADLYPLQVVSDNGSNVWFVTISDTSEPYSFPVNECQAPEGSSKDAEKEAEAVHQEIIGRKALLFKMRERIPALEEEYSAQLGSLDLYLAGAAGETAAENRLSVLTGFAPSEMDAALQAEFDKMDVFYMAEKASEEDNPPIKLRNNRFAKMFEVLTGMYGMPAYNEFDLTPILAPFFLLFFALCLGDAGYGLLLVAIGFILKKKVKSMASLAPLVVTLGIGTFFIGTLLNTFFGFSLIDQSFIPEWLKACIRPLQGEVAGFPATMVLAIGIGIFNICVAMITKSLCYTHRFGLKNTLGTWGWTLLVVGSVILGGIALLGLLQSEVIKWIFIVLAIISGLGIYIFNKPGRNPLINIGSGLWDTYNMVTGLMGDTLSFIRLYALGLAGGMLGSTFNTLGGMLMDSCPVPGLNWLLFAVIFVIGHALNLALSCLGAFVHPLRLTFVEFFKNSGYEGSGKPYNPLTVKKDEI